MLRSILQKSFVTALVCLLAGIIIYGLRVFDIHRPTFQFVSTGILGSLFFFTLRQAGVRHAFLVLLLFYVIMTGLLTNGYRHGMLLHDAVYVAAVGIALFLFSSRIYHRDDPHQWISPIILGALMGAVMLLATLLLALGGHLPGDVPLLSVFRGIGPVVIMNFVIGLGLGTGIIMCEYLPAATAGTGQVQKKS
jgi:hypothetical protein